MIAKLWKTGGSLVITLKEETRQYYDLEEGDIIEIDIKNIKKKGKPRIKS